MARDRRPQLTVRQACGLFKLLSDEPRLRLLLLLARGEEMSVTALCEGVGMSQPAVSHHLTLLRLGGVVTFRRDGKHNFYSLHSDLAREFLRYVKA